MRIQLRAHTSARKSAAAQASKMSNVSAGATVGDISTRRIDVMRIVGAIAGAPTTGLISALLAPFKATPAPVVGPKDVQRMPETSLSDIGALVDSVYATKDQWVETGVEARVELLKECITSLKSSAEEYAGLQIAQKGSYGEGSGAAVSEVAMLIIACQSHLSSLSSNFCDPVQGVRKLPSGHTAVEVFPQLPLDTLVYGPGSAELWIKPGAELKRGETYKRKRRGEGGAGEVALVLGAGNQMTIMVLDVLHQLLSEDRVVVLKMDPTSSYLVRPTNPIYDRLGLQMNPINDYLGPWLERALAPLFSRGLVKVCYGGARQGAHLTDHPKVAAIHLTGSQATYNAIVFGGQPGPGAVPRIAKPVTAELGNVTPYIVVPGQWSRGEMEYWAKMLVFAKGQNAGHNCIAAEVVVTDRGWAQREEFLGVLREAFSQTTNRWSFYPGTDAKASAFMERFPLAHCIRGPPGVEGATPWMLAEGLTEEECWGTEEKWCVALQEVALDGDGSVGDFLQKATRFCNDKLYGTLACTVVCDPRTQKANGAALEGALAELRYGSVCLNLPAPLAFVIPQMPWGAWDAGRGSDPADVGTGVGFVHNACMFEDVEKGVLRFPFVIRPKPCYLMDHRNWHRMGPRILEAVSGNYAAVLSLIWASLRG